MTELLFFALGVLVTLAITGVQWYASAWTSHRQRLSDFMRPPRDAFKHLADAVNNENDADLQQLRTTAKEAVERFESMLQTYRAEFPKSGIVHGLYWNIYAGLIGALERMQREEDEARVRNMAKMIATIGVSTFEKVPTIQDFRNAGM